MIHTLKFCKIGVNFDVSNDIRFWAVGSFLPVGSFILV